jgi:hypothetical protein
MTKLWTTTGAYLLVGVVGLFSSRLAGELLWPGQMGWIVVSTAVFTLLPLLSLSYLPRQVNHTPYWPLLLLAIYVIWPVPPTMAGGRGAGHGRVHPPPHHPTNQQTNQ